MALVDPRSRRVSWGDGGVEQVPLRHQPRAGAERDDHASALAALVAMDLQDVGVCQLCSRSWTNSTRRPAYSHPAAGRRGSDSVLDLASTRLAIAYELGIRQAAAGPRDQPGWQRALHGFGGRRNVGRDPTLAGEDACSAAASSAAWQIVQSISRTGGQALASSSTATATNLQFPRGQYDFRSTAAFGSAMGLLEAKHWPRLASVQPPPSGPRVVIVEPVIRPKGHLICKWQGCNESLLSTVDCFC